MRRLLMLVFACWLTACIPHAPDEDKKDTGPPLFVDGLKVGKVVVDVDPLVIPRTYRKTLSLYGVTDRLRDSVIRRLQRRKLYDKNGILWLHIEIMDFSLRSDLIALLPFPILETDRLELSVEAWRDGAVVKSFTALGSNGQGGLMNAIGRAKRLDIVIEAASFQVLQPLMTAGLE